MSWEMVLLGDVIETLKGYAFKSGHYVESGVPIVRASNFTMDSISNDDLKFYTEDEATQFRKYELSTDDVLIQTVGSWESNPASVVGKVVRVPQLLDGALLNQNIVKVFPADKDQLDLQYLFYRLKCHDFKRHNIGNAVGAANQASITLDTIRAFAFLLPNIVEQRRIATILRGYDDLIENNQKQIKLLEEAAQRLYKEWFMDLRFPGHKTTPITDGIPEGWKRERLIDIVKVQYGYAFDGSLFNANGNGTPIVRIRNIPAGTTADYTTEDADPQYVVHNGDILVGMDGEFHINSWSGPDAYLVQRTCSFRPSNSNMKGYLLQAIYEPIKYFESTVVGATVAHLGKKHIDTITVLTGPKELYIPFQQYFERRQLLLNQNRLLAEARDRLLPKLMNGEIEV